MTAPKRVGINVLKRLKAMVFNLVSVTGFMGSWVYVFMSSWVHGFMGLKAVRSGLFAYMDARIPKYSNTQTLEHSNTRTPEHINTRTLKKLFFPAILILSLAASAQSKIVNPHGLLKWECESCHTPRSFYRIKNPPDFDHKETGFLLDGRHQFAPCAGCHQNMVLSRVASVCADCHKDVHRGQFGFDCQNCHNPDSWESRRNILGIHAARGFALVGVHAMADCQACHIDEQRNEFTLTSTECATCHIGDYLATTAPDHVAAGFGLNCRSCHQLLAVGWKSPDSFGTTDGSQLKAILLPQLQLDRIRNDD